MAMPSYERRFFLSLLTKNRKEQEEKMKEMQEKNQNKNAKGKRQTRVGGDQLKTRMKNGDIPLQ